MAGFQLPKLPTDWEYVDEVDPNPLPDAATAQATADKGVGSVLREIAGPQKPPETPTFINNFLKPVGEQVFDTLVPHTPRDVGIFAASLALGGPGSSAAMKLAPKVAPTLDALGSSALRRIMGVGAAGALGSKMQGENPLWGAAAGIATQLGGEGVAKLSKWLGMNKQAVDLATEDPERLGEVVSQVIPGLPGLRSAKDFHAAFKKGGAQVILSKAYSEGMDEVSGKMAGQLLPSQVMTELRGPAKSVTAGIPAGARGMTASSLFGGGGTGQPGRYTVDDIAETIRRLRYQGWNGDELARGLIAKDARATADALQTELLSQLPAEVGEQFIRTNEQYARGKRLMDFFGDKDLLDSKGDLNMPKLQQALKKDGYSVGDSLQLAADAALLEKGLFRGASTLAEDVPGAPGKLMNSFHWHFGFIPTMTSKIPQVGSYAGRAPYGLSPAGGSLLTQTLKHGISDRRPITLSADDDE